MAPTKTADKREASIRRKSSPPHIDYAAVVSCGWMIKETVTKNELNNTLRARRVQKVNIWQILKIKTLLKSK